MKLDPDLTADAKARADEALSLAAYHESVARAARAKAGVLARTWGFDLPEKAGEKVDTPPPVA